MTNDRQYFDYLEDEAAESIRQDDDDRRERFQEQSIPNLHPVTLYVRVLRRDGSPSTLPSRSTRLRYTLP